MANRLVTLEEVAKGMADSFKKIADEHKLTPEQRVAILNAWSASMFYSGGPSKPDKASRKTRVKR